MNLGIDKIQLHTSEYSLDSADSSLFGFNTSTKQGETDIPLLLVDKQGVIIKAKSIFRNTQLANYTINKFGLQVQFNPSPQYHPYHLIEPQDKRFTQVVDKVKQELDRAGIGCCLDSMQLTRFDVANQQDMRLTPVAYNQVFALLKGKVLFMVLLVSALYSILSKFFSAAWYGVFFSLSAKSLSYPMICQLLLPNK